MSKVEAMRNENFSPKEKVYIFYIVTDDRAHMDHIYAVHKNEKATGYNDDKFITSEIFSVERASIKAMKFTESGKLLVLDSHMNLIVAKRHKK